MQDDPLTDDQRERLKRSVTVTASSLAIVLRFEHGFTMLLDATERKSFTIVTAAGKAGKITFTTDLPNEHTTEAAKREIIEALTAIGINLSDSGVSINRPTISPLPPPDPSLIGDLIKGGP